MLVEMKDETVECIKELREEHDKSPNRISKEAVAGIELLKTVDLMGAALILALGGMLMTDTELKVVEET